MKAIKFMAVLLTSVLIFSGCGDKKISDYDKIQKNLMSMTGYTCNAEIKYISNRGENTYQTTQWVLSDGRYKIETSAPDSVKGGIILFDGKMLWQYNPQLNSRVSLHTPDKPERTQINIFTFLNNMVNSQDVGVESASLDESLYTVFEAKIPGSSKFFSSEKLWVENKTMLPARLEIYDTEGETRVEAAFTNFEYNPEIPDSVFSLDNSDK